MSMSVADLTGSDVITVWGKPAETMGSMANKGFIEILNVSAKNGFLQTTPR